VLKQHPDRVDTKVLEQFPEFIAFKSRAGTRTRKTGTGPPTPAGVSPGGGTSPGDTTPKEVMEAAYHELRSALAGDLIQAIKRQSPEFFEHLVLDVLTGMGYGGSRTDAAEQLGRSGDGGIDGVIREDALGLDVIYVQAKRWENPVGRPVIQGFVGALHGAHADKGVLITTSTFTPDASNYAEGVAARIILIDGSHLAELMIDHDVGVSETSRYRLKRIDTDYFEDSNGSAE